MKKVFLLLVLLCMMLCGCKKQEQPEDLITTITKRGEMIVGVRDDTAPFGFKDKDGNLVGLDIDIARTIAKNLLGDENKIKFVTVTASNRIETLCSGKVDILVATMSITDQRQIMLNFSSPYYIAGQAILTKTSNKSNSLRDFRNKKLIVVFGSTGERNLRTNVPDVEVLGFKTYQEAYRALKDGKADGILADDTILMNYVINDKNVKILPKRFSQEPYAVAVRKDNESLKLLEKIDYIVDNLESTGKLYKMQEKWGIK